MKVKLLPALIGMFLITIGTANADIPYPEAGSAANTNPSSPSPGAASAAAQGDIVDSGGNLKIMPQSSQKKMLGPGSVQPIGAPSAMPQGAMPQGAMPQGAMPQGAMPQGAMPQGAMPQGAMPQGAMPQGAMPQGAMPPSAPAGNIPMPGGAQ